MASERDIARAVLDRYGRTYADELSIALRRRTPAPLFQLLCAAMLMSARISADIATRATKALFDAGWTTVPKMARSTWKQRTRTLNRAGYARYDERTATMLGETAELLLERYGGDLRRLRDAAGRDPEEERRLLKECKGIGDTGADIFFREAQAVWDELRPFADRRALATAKRLGLRGDARSLAGLVAAEDFPRLVAGLVRIDLEGSHDELKEAV